MIENRQEYYQKAEGKTKHKICSCILSEKITFDENKDAAISYTVPIRVLFNASKGLESSKNKKEVENELLSYMAPPSGLEPETL